MSYPIIGMMTTRVFSPLDMMITTALVWTSTTVRTYLLPPEPPGLHGRFSVSQKSLRLNGHLDLAVFVTTFIGVIEVHSGCLQPLLTCL